MQFNSLVFLLFMGIFFAGWPLLRKRQSLRWGYLVTASFVFYGWWDWRFLFLILFSGLVDFFAGLGMGRLPTRKRTFLVFSLIGNIGSLGLFKYLDFGIANANGLLSWLGVETQMPMANLILPVGISFYTFQSMSYTIDIFRGQLRPTGNILHFFAYLSLFPQLVAGPIVRAKDLLPQLKQSGPLNESDRWDGLQLMVRGFFKKIVIADTLAPVVNEAFGANTPAVSGAYWWLMAVMFAYQIYCDFSGYSDIARGLGRWMGYHFPVNFDHPYIAGSFQEFWQRWHISLSTWFRDYVYIPLGGRRSSGWRLHRNLWITFMISGLWHGAAWNFLIWGGLHGCYLSLERWSGWTEKLQRVPGGRHWRVLTVFVSTLIGWVFFRAENLGQALAILGQMFNPLTFHPEMIDAIVDNNAINVLMLILARQLFFHFKFNEVKPWLSARQERLVEPVVTAVLILMCVYMPGPGNTFIYFQF